MNSMEPEFKLRVAFEMAESVAYLQNMGSGIIVHGDIRITQLLCVAGGKDHWNTTVQVLKIGDFSLERSLREMTRRKENIVPFKSDVEEEILINIEGH